MNKGERLEITVAVLATEEIDDDTAFEVASNIVIDAMASLKKALPVKRFITGWLIGEGLVRRHKRSIRTAQHRIVQSPKERGPIQ